MKKIILILALLFSLDGIYATYQAQQNKIPYSGYTHKSKATVLKNEPTHSRCTDKKTLCSYNQLRYIYNDDKGKKNTTELNDAFLTQEQTGKQIEVLCDTKIWICLPMDYIHAKTSILNHLTLVKIINKFR